MRFLALASDYDGTLATDGRVFPETLKAIERLRESGRKLVLVTGRELDELIEVFPEIDLCEWVVAENGALLYHPASRTERPLGEPPPPDFIQALDARGVSPYSVGRVILATWHPHETTVLELIREFGLELQVIFNKGAVMVLPSGVNKATGLAAALSEMDLSPHNAVGIGDAENDHALLTYCECGAATANALPKLKERADLVTRGDHGAGVEELIDRLLEDDLRSLEPALARHHILLGANSEGAEIRLPPFGTNILVAGSSGGGKSTLATGFMERVAEADYQFCVIDPEGDYEDFADTVSVGTSAQPPDIPEVEQILAEPNRNAVVNVMGVPLADRPQFFLKLLATLQQLRSRTGHPHWIIVDEAHHVLPAQWQSSDVTVPREVSGMMFVTLEPHLLAMGALSAVDTVVGVGEMAAETIHNFGRAIGRSLPASLSRPRQQGEVLIWNRRAQQDPFLMTVAPAKAVRRRHSRKYAQGDLGVDRSFYFRGPQDKLKLKAQNLIVFLQMADGVDDDTWLHHLRRQDYSRWFREGIKDDELATRAAAIEKDHLDPQQSRAALRAMVEERYTLPGAY